MENMTMILPQATAWHIGGNVANYIEKIVQLKKWGKLLCYNILFHFRTIQNLGGKQTEETSDWNVRCCLQEEILCHVSWGRGERRGGGSHDITGGGSEFNEDSEPPWHIMKCATVTLILIMMSVKKMWIKKIRMSLRNKLIPKRMSLTKKILLRTLNPVMNLVNCVRSHF